MHRTELLTPHSFFYSLLSCLLSEIKISDIGKPTSGEFLHCSLSCCMLLHSEPQVPFPDDSIANEAGVIKTGVGNQSSELGAINHNVSHASFCMSCYSWRQEKYRQEKQGNRRRSGEGKWVGINQESRMETASGYRSLEQLGWKNNSLQWKAFLLSLGDLTGLMKICMSPSITHPGKLAFVTFFSLSFHRELWHVKVCQAQIGGSATQNLSQEMQ